MKKAEWATKNVEKKLRGKAVNLSPGEAAKKQALLKEYSYNIEIQKKFKTQGAGILDEEGNLTQQDYDDAVSKNIAIMNQLEELGIRYNIESVADQLIAQGRKMQGKGAYEAMPEKSEGRAGYKSYRDAKTGNTMRKYPDGKQEVLDPKGKVIATRGGKGASKEGVQYSRDKADGPVARGKMPARKLSSKEEVGFQSLF